MKESQQKSGTSGVDRTAERQRGGTPSRRRDKQQEDIQRTGRTAGNYEANGAVSAGKINLKVHGYRGKSGGPGRREFGKGTAPSRKKNIKRKHQRGKVRTTSKCPSNGAITAEKSTIHRKISDTERGRGVSAPPTIV